MAATATCTVPPEGWGAPRCGCLLTTTSMGGPLVSRGRSRSMDIAGVQPTNRRRSSLRSRGFSATWRTPRRRPSASRQCGWTSPRRVGVAGERHDTAAGRHSGGLGARAALRGGRQAMRRAQQALGRLPTGVMNRTEGAYGAHLDGLVRDGVVLDYRFEAIKLRLADNTFYSPDFFVQLADRTLECHEVKGFWTDDARVKIKVAAALVPWFRFS